MGDIYIILWPQVLYQSTLQTNKTIYLTSNSPCKDNFTDNYIQVNVLNYYKDSYIMKYCALNLLVAG